MPMYFPDLKSVKQCAEDMATHQKPEKKYKGLIPYIEKELPEARKQLGHYFRTVWQDTIQALEIELAVTKEDYEQKIGDKIKAQFMARAFNLLSSHEKETLRDFGDCPF